MAEALVDEEVGGLWVGVGIGVTLLLVVGLDGSPKNLITVEGHQ